MEIEFNRLHDRKRKGDCIRDLNKRGSIRDKQAGHDLRHRPSRVVALFHGQQVVAASRARKRGRKGLEKCENARARIPYIRKNTCAK